MFVHLHHQTEPAVLRVPKGAVLEETLNVRSETSEHLSFSIHPGSGQVQHQFGAMVDSKTFV
jgi:hypothetical protein